MKHLIILCLIYICSSQDVIDVSERQSPIEIDGIVTDEEWNNIKPLNLISVQPVYVKTIDQPTEIRLTYDENFIYVSARMFINSNGSVRANSFARDSWNGDDTFGVLFDSFNDNRNMLWFYTNPNGSRAEMEVFNEGEQLNSNWNTFWRAESTYDDKGWYAEVRIPFSSLKFEPDQDEVTMGLITYRYMADGSKRYIFPDIKPEWSRPHTKASLAKKIRFKNIKQSNPTYISPYALTDVNRLSTLDTTRRNFSNSSNVDFGIDAKLNLDAQQTLDLTLNMDFAQAEADDGRINTTRFNLFFPEKRRFFQERSELFLFNFYGSDRLFHSRRIGLDPVTRQPIRIIGGMRYTAKYDNTDIGSLIMQTEGSSGIDSENFSVVRLRQSILDDQSTTGFMYTGRVINSDNYSMMFASDTEINWSDQHFLTFKYATSMNSTNDYDFTESSKFFLRLNNRSFSGWTYSLYYSLTGKDYLPTMGFQRRTDEHFYGFFVDYIIQGTEEDYFRRYRYGLWGNLNQRRSDNEIDTFWYHPYAEILLKDGMSFLISTYTYEENLLNSFDIQDQTIAAGSYNYTDVFIQFDSPDGWYFKPRGVIRFGDFYNGTRQVYDISINWVVNNHLNISPSIRTENIQLPGQPKLKLNNLRTNINLSLDKNLSGRVLLQYQDFNKRVSVNSRIRYNFTEGHDIWLVYNDLYEKDLINNRFTDYRSSNRSLILKYTNTFTF